MKYFTKGEMASDIDNAVEVNKNNNEPFCHRVDAIDNSSSSRDSITSPSQTCNGNHLLSPVVKTPTHFHHPEYIKEVDNYQPRVTQVSRQLVSNPHPDSGVDYSSIVEVDQFSWPWSTSSSPWCFCSWQSRWEDKVEKVEQEKMKRRQIEKRQRNAEEIRKLPCSLGKMVLEEQEQLEANLELEGLDPRVASMSPSANNPFCSKPRFKSSLNSSPSRLLRDAREQTQSVNCLIPQKDDNMNMKSSNAKCESELFDEENVDNGTFIVVNQEKILKGNSMPEISKHIKLFPYHILSTLNPRLPKGVDRTRLEQHLTYKEFQQIFGMSRDEFWRLPKWKRMEIKKEVHLF